jgi:hypothetical protein
MSQLGNLFAHHPLWMLGAAALAVLVAAWIVVGGEQIQSRHGAHVFGPDEHSRT